MTIPNSKVRVLTVGLLLVFVTLAVYWPVHQFEFVTYDDPDYVTWNPFVQAGLSWKGVTWAFSSFHACNWHPLTWLSHMLDCQLYGLNPAGHHVTNLLFHLANTILVFFVLGQMTGAFWRSAVVAALFAWHPLHVESVAWVAERKDVLSTFFFLLSLWAYTRYAAEAESRKQKTEMISSFSFQFLGATKQGGGGSAFYWLSLLFFSLSLLSKPMFVTLPFLLLLLDYWPLCRFQIPGAAKRSDGPLAFQRFSVSAFQLLPWRRLLLEKLPFFVLSAVSCLVTYWAQRAGGAVGSVPIPMRLANAAISYVTYIGKTFWPEPLAAFYAYPSSFPAGKIILAAAFLLGASLLVYRIARRQQRGYLFTGWFWFLGTLVPVIGLVQVGGQAMADRYTYVSSIGLFILLAWGLADVWLRWRLSPGALVLITIGALAGCILKTGAQLKYWQDSVALFTHAALVSPDSALVHNNLGTALFNQGKREAAKDEFLKAIELKPDHGLARSNLGMILSQENRIEDAKLQLAEAVRLRPKDVSVRNNYGAVLLLEGKLDEAAHQFLTGLSFNPFNAEAHANLGNVCLRRGDAAAALRYYADALRINPRHSEALIGRARAFIAQGQFDEASAILAAEFGIDQKAANAIVKIGAGLARRGDVQEALVYLERAIRDGVNPAEIHYNLGHILLLRQKPEEGMAHFREAIRLRPSFVEAYNDLAWNLATHHDPKIRNGTEAVQLASRAVELTRTNDAGALDTLGAALAEAGRFDEAVKVMRDAVDDARTEGNWEIASQFRERLQLYQSKRPFRE